MTPVVLASESGAATQKWLKVIQQHYPDLDAHVFDPQAGEPVPNVRAAIVWKPPAALFSCYRELDLVFNMGAGVDAILRQPDIPAHTRIIRLEDAGLAKPMTEYVIHFLSGITRQFGTYERNRERRLWQAAEQTPVQHRTVGVMGMGVIGARIAQALSELDYPVQGWSRSPKAVAGVKSFHGEDQLGAFLASSEFLINVLPLTDQTRDILNQDTLGQLPKGAVLINIGRGEHLVEADLITVLDAGHLSHAILDVAREEPLPGDHPFWTHPAITLTPHISGPTNHYQAIGQIRGKLLDALQGKPISGEVTRQAGY